MDYTTLLAHRSFLTSGSDEFALMYSKLAGQIAKDEDVALYRSILEGNAPGMEDLSPEDHRDVRFGAFYVLCVYYRRQKEFTVLTRLVNSRAAAFSEEPLYKFQKAVAMKSGFPNAETLAKAITLFQEIMSEQEAADEMPFFAQAYADTVASYYDELNKDTLSKEDLRVLDDAIAMIRRAIAIRKNYAKYYFTLAKLYRLTGQFALAKENIRRAIEKEDSTQTDYALRINEFEILNSRIDLERDIRDEVDALTEMQAEFAEMKADIEKSKSEIEKSKFDILSFLGFFTGIISFILGSFQLGGGLEFSQRVQLMAVLLCCLMIAFSVFRLLIGQHKAKDLLLCLLVVIISFGLLITCKMLFV